MPSPIAHRLAVISLALSIACLCAHGLAFLVRNSPELHLFSQLLNAILVLAPAAFLIALAAWRASRCRFTALTPLTKAAVLLSSAFVLEILAFMGLTLWTYSHCPENVC
jgi:hypothetical protein